MFVPSSLLVFNMANCFDTRYVDKFQWSVLASAIRVKFAPSGDKSGKASRLVVDFSNLDSGLQK